MAVCQEQLETGDKRDMTRHKKQTGGLWGSEAVDKNIQLQTLDGHEMENP